jgi:hypothetical protein
MDGVVAVDVDRTSDETPELASADLPPVLCLCMRTLEPLDNNNNITYH